MKKQTIAILTLGTLLTSSMAYAALAPSELDKINTMIQQEELRNQAILDEMEEYKTRLSISDQKLGNLIGVAEAIRKETTPTTTQESKDVLSGNFKPAEKPGIDEFLKVNGAEFVKEAGDVFRKVGEHYKIQPEVLVAIAMADSSLGQALKGKNNIGNVGSFDRGGTIHYATLEAGIEAMGKTLNNGYLGSHKTIGELSNGGRTALGLKACGVDGAKCYATSAVNWNRNVLAALQNMFQDKNINESYNFRTE